MAKGGNASTTFTGSPETFQHELDRHVYGQQLSGRLV